MYNMMTIVNTAVMIYRKVVKSVDPEFSSQEKHFLFIVVIIS